MTVTFGRHSYVDGGLNVHSYAAAGEDAPSITIGNYCSIAEDVEFLPGGMHDTHRVTTFPLGRILPDVAVKPRLKGPIIVGHDVWIGRGARLLGDVTIGNGAIIGAYAVIAADVIPFSIVVGNPARIVRYRFDYDTIQALQQIAWWHWDDHDPRLPDVWHLHPEAFIARHLPTT